MDLPEIGMMIKEARQQKGLTQTQLAARAGLSRSRIDALENGRASDIGFRNVASALSAVGLEVRVTPAAGRPTLDDLMQEEEEGHAPRMG